MKENEIKVVKEAVELFLNKPYNTPCSFTGLLKELGYEPHQIYSSSRLWVLYHGFLRILKEKKVFLDEPYTNGEIVGVPYNLAFWRVEKPKKVNIEKVVHSYIFEYKANIKVNDKAPFRTIYYKIDYRNGGYYASKSIKSFNDKKIIMRPVEICNDQIDALKKVFLAYKDYIDKLPSINKKECNGYNITITFRCEELRKKISGIELIQNDLTLLNLLQDMDQILLNASPINHVCLNNVMVNEII